VEQTVVITAKGAVFEGKTPEIVTKQLTAAMYEATAFMEREVKSETPQGVFGQQGGLISTIFGDVSKKGVAVVRGKVGHQSKHGDIVEKGRTAGKAWPPEGALLRWIEVKLGVDERTALQLEFVIRRKIGQKGFKGAHMFEKAYNEGWSTVKKIFDRYGFNIAKKIDGK
jgi:hypothetical protein